MKKILLIAALVLVGCDRNVSKDLVTDQKGQVTINGKACEVVSINIGNEQPRLLFVDCGPGSTSVTYPVGKTQQSVGQYTSQTESCPCRRTDDGRLDCPTPPCVKIIEPATSSSPCPTDLKKIQEIKKDFYK